MISHAGIVTPKGYSRFRKLDVVPVMGFCLSPGKATTPARIYKSR